MVEGATYVNFDEIEGYCNSMQDIGSKMLSTFEEVQSNIQSLPNYWVGEAAQSYIDEINTLIEKLEPAQKELVLSILFLASVGEGYDNLSNSVAESLKAIVANSPLSFDPNTTAINSLGLAAVSELQNPAEDMLDEKLTPEIAASVLENNEGESQPLEPSSNPTEEVKSEAEQSTVEPATPVTGTPSTYQNIDEDLNEQVDQRKQSAAEQKSETPTNQVEVLDLSDDRKSIEEVAREVIYGHYGNGPDRAKKLEADGYDVDEVQAKVNELMRG